MTDRIPYVITACPTCTRDLTSIEGTDAYRCPNGHLFHWNDLLSDRQHPDQETTA